MDGKLAVKEPIIWALDTPLSIHLIIPISMKTGKFWMLQRTPMLQKAHPPIKLAGFMRLMQNVKTMGREQSRPALFCQ